MTEPGKYERLKLRVERNGDSDDEGHRHILREVLAAGRSPQTLKDLLLEIPDVGEDADFEGRRGACRGTANAVDAGPTRVF
ncbi:MAG TPA: hypothetical protein VJL81_11330 [Solirubrobacterales bacterium]|nr:hypothetical protein [Solirubrobacterales bacterium]